MCFAEKFYHVREIITVRSKVLPSFLFFGCTAVLFNESATSKRLWLLTEDKRPDVAIMRFAVRLPRMRTASASRTGSDSCNIQPSSGLTHFADANRPVRMTSVHQGCAAFLCVTKNNLRGVVVHFVEAWH